MSPVTLPDIAGAWDQAHKESVTLAARDKAEHLLATIGPRIAAASLGMADARQLKRWAADGEEPRAQVVAQRLDALYWIVRAIEQIYSAAVAARFLRSTNPQLIDEAPLSVLAAADDTDDIRRVLSATRAFLDG